MGIIEILGRKAENDKAACNEFCEKVNAFIKETEQIRNFMKFMSDVDKKYASKSCLSIDV